MPEGDTIRRLAERINRRFAGERCERSVTRDPRLVHVDFAGTVLREADARGKHLLIRFDDARTLFAHLRLDGSFTVGPVAREAVWRRRVELWMETGRLTAVDVPVLGVVATAREEDVVGHLGPDLCGPAPPDLAVVVERMAERPDEPLAGALLDQRNVAGFGNVYAVELPFIAGVSPNQRVGTVDGLGELLGFGAAVIRTNAVRGPQNTTGRRLRVADHWIYGRREPPVPAVRDHPRRLGRARQPVAPGRHVVPELPAGRTPPDRRRRPGAAPPGSPPGPARTDVPVGLTAAQACPGPPAVPCTGTEGDRDACSRPDVVVLPAAPDPGRHPGDRPDAGGGRADRRPLGVHHRAPRRRPRGAGREGDGSRRRLRHHRRQRPVRGCRPAARHAPSPVWPAGCSPPSCTRSS